MNEYLEGFDPRDYRLTHEDFCNVISSADNACNRHHAKHDDVRRAPCPECMNGESCGHLIPEKEAR